MDSCGLLSVFGVRLVIVLLFGLLAAPRGRCCTQINVAGPNGTLVVVHGEENALSFGQRASVVRRGTLLGNSSSGCMSFQSQFGFIAGMNEKGLAVNNHALDLAVFQTPEEGVPSLCVADVASFALGMHSTVDELVGALSKVRVVGPDGSCLLYTSPSPRDRG